MANETSWLSGTRTITEKTKSLRDCCLEACFHGCCHCIVRFTKSDTLGRQLRCCSQFRAEIIYVFMLLSPAGGTCNRPLVNCLRKRVTQSHMRESSHHIKVSTVEKSKNIKLYTNNFQVYNPRNPSIANQALSKAGKNLNN